MNKESKVKNLYEKEISKIKRQYSSIASYGDIQAKKTISRLQAQVKSMKENKENLIESKHLFSIFEENKKNPSEEYENKESSLEIRKLKSKIEELENEKLDKLYDKSSYIEGSYWMSNEFFSFLFFLIKNFKKFK